MSMVSRVLVAVRPSMGKTRAGNTPATHENKGPSGVCSETRNTRNRQSGDLGAGDLGRIRNEGEVIRKVSRSCNDQIEDSPLTTGVRPRRQGILNG